MLTRTITNQPLAKTLRAKLENTVKAAREVAEKGAHAALDQLGVGEAKAPDYLTDELKALRRRLRAHGRALGDIKGRGDIQGVQHLVWEVAYEHWHRMLFARFLAENGLLMWELGAPVSLDDCRDMVDNHPDLVMGAKTHWELAGKLAARMLPQVFKPHSPVFELAFAPENQRELEKLLAGLPEEVFKASDSLGWVYQFWQAKRKSEVNASEVKIGADELPAVTQLFTEPYMVDFLLHNSLGAWWATRHPGKPCPVTLTYLRKLENGTPAAGKFEGWPDTLAEFKLLDPCCGSGHFLVAAFLMLVPMRMEAEGMSARDAADAVLADNLHGLELDARCVEIAVFALALAAWCFPDENGAPLGARADMPAPNIACCGLKVAASPKDWEALVPDGATNADHLRQELRLLHASFAQAPLLGSLLDPARSLRNDLATPSVETLRGLLEQALAIESIERPSPANNAAYEHEDDSWDLAVTASGLLDAARLLSERYDLVATNVPYLGIRKQAPELRQFAEGYYPLGRHDLATIFLERLHELTGPYGAVAAVSPNRWQHLSSYESLRRWLLTECSLLTLAQLGTGAFDGISGEVVNVILTIANNRTPSFGHVFVGIDVESAEGAEKKASLLQTKQLLGLTQSDQLSNPDARLLMEVASGETLLSEYAESLAGIQNGDSPRFLRQFWELPELNKYWVPLQQCVNETVDFDGCDQVINYDLENGHLRESKDIRRERLHDSDQRGKSAWGRPGILISRMGNLPCALYTGVPFDQNAAIILPRRDDQLSAIWMFCQSDEYSQAVRRIDAKINVTSATLTKVPFDLEKWSASASERYPAGLPKPLSHKANQWLFHGHPQPSTESLQVAVAR
ncbi:Eco57I restriction-modification methylase domain-containing protein, partial [Ralstonia pseudosolanacearum]|uniref:Eco57I restriction-modification methylase domain-containing protein n=1 Tax=Ralstonia pseudosolanacearum TaxID=1310165 RepID=UPI000DAD9B01